jgi:hypothetical protein
MQTYASGLDRTTDGGLKAQNGSPGKAYPYFSKLLLGVQVFDP